MHIKKMYSRYPRTVWQHMIDCYEKAFARGQQLHQLSTAERAEYEICKQLLAESK